jgi:hypothetical protein
MKKYLLILILAVIIIPQVTFASWWNPFSWFGFSIVRNSKTDNLSATTSPRASSSKAVSLEKEVVSQAPYINNTTVPSKKTSLGKNSNDVVIAVDEGRIKDIKSYIDIIKESISLVEQRIKYVEGRRNLVASAKSGDKTSDNTWDILIKADEGTIKYYGEVNTYLIQIVSNLEESSKVAQQDLSLAKSKFYNSDQARDKSLSILDEDKKDLALFEKADKILDDFDNFDRENEAGYRAAVERAISYIEANKPNVHIPNIIYRPFVPSQVQTPQFTHCTVSGDGVGLQSYVNCSSSSF